MQYESNPFDGSRDMAQKQNSPKYTQKTCFSPENGEAKCHEPQKAQGQVNAT